MKNAIEEIITLLGNLDWLCGRDMYEDPRGLGEEYRAARMWRNIYDLFQIINLLDNSQINSIKKDAKKNIQTLISKIDLSQIHNISGMEYRKKERRIFIACNFAYHMLIAYGMICRQLSLLDEANELFIFALKLDLIKEGWYWRYEKAIEAVEEDNAGHVACLKITIALKSQSATNFLSDYDNFLQDFFQDSHKKGEKYTKETMTRFDLPKHLLHIAATELAIIKIEEKSYSFVKMIISEYDVDIKRLTNPCLNLLKEILLRDSSFDYDLRDASPLIKIAIKVPGVFNIAKKLAKKYISQECNTHLAVYNNSPGTISEIARIYHLEEFLLDRIELVFKKELRDYQETTNFSHKEIVEKLEKRIVRSDVPVVNIYTTGASWEDRFTSVIGSMLRNYELTINDIERR